MTASDIYHRVTIYRAGRSEPLVTTISLLIGEVTGAATEHITVVSVTVSAFDIGIIASIRIIRPIRRFIIPTCTFLEVARILIRPLICCIRLRNVA